MKKFLSALKKKNTKGKRTWGKDQKKPPIKWEWKKKNRTAVEKKRHNKNQKTKGGRGECALAGEKTQRVAPR